MVALAVTSQLWLTNGWRYIVFAEVSSNLSRADAMASSEPHQFDWDFECDRTTGNNHVIEGQTLRFDLLQSARRDRDARAGAVPDSSVWYPRITITRIQRKILVPWIAASTFFGTMIWAYGHRIFH